MQCYGTTPTRNALPLCNMKYQINFENAQPNNIRLVIPVCKDPRAAHEKSSGRRTFGGGLTPRRGETMSAASGNATAKLMKSAFDMLLSPKSKGFDRVLSKVLLHF